jgi:hypothetical protein
MIIISPLRIKITKLRPFLAPKQAIFGVDLTGPQILFVNPRWIPTQNLLCPQLCQRLLQNLIHISNWRTFDLMTCFPLCRIAVVCGNGRCWYIYSTVRLAQMSLLDYTPSLLVLVGVLYHRCAYWGHCRLIYLSPRLAGLTAIYCVKLLWNCMTSSLCSLDAYHTEMAPFAGMNPFNVMITFIWWWIELCLRFLWRGSSEPCLNSSLWWAFRNSRWVILFMPCFL